MGRWELQWEYQTSFKVRILGEWREVVPGLTRATRALGMLGFVDRIPLPTTTPPITENPGEPFTVSSLQSYLQLSRQTIGWLSEEGTYRTPNVDILASISAEVDRKGGYVAGIGCDTNTALRVALREKPRRCSVDLDVARHGAWNHDRGRWSRRSG